MEADERRRQMEWRLQNVIRSQPGIDTWGAVRAAVQDLPMRQAEVLSLLHHLTECGIVEQRKLGRRHCFFVAGSKMLLRWREVAALGEENLRELAWLIAEAGRVTMTQIQVLAEQRLGWSATTTAYRLQRLREANIIKQERPGNRYSSFELRIHLEFLQEIDLQWQLLRDDTGNRNSFFRPAFKYEGQLPAANRVDAVCHPMKEKSIP